MARHKNQYPTQAYKYYVAETKYSTGKERVAKRASKSYEHAKADCKRRAEAYYNGMSMAYQAHHIVKAYRHGYAIERRTDGEPVVSYDVRDEYAD